MSEPQRSRITATLVKAETAYGADAGPTGANGVLVTGAPEFTADADKEDRQIYRDTYSPAGSIIGAKSAKLKLKVEMRGGGIDSVTSKPKAPDYDPLLLACGMQRTEVERVTLEATAAWQAGETVTGGTSAAHGTVEYIERDNLIVLSSVTGTFAAAETVTGGTSAATGTVASLAPGLMYRPKTYDIDTMPSASVRFYKDKILHKIAGVVGTWSLTGEVGKLAYLEFELSGLWVDPEDAVIPALTLSDMTGPQALAMGLRIGAYTPVANALKLNLGAKIEKRNDLNGPDGLIGFVITSREPTGSLDPETDTLAAYNPWATWKSGAKFRLGGYLGSVAGNRWAVHVGQAQCTELKYGERTGVVTYDKTFTPCQERLGDDELRLTLF